MRADTITRAQAHAKLSKELVGRIREAVAAGITQRALAEAYGVTSSAISNVVRGVTWRHQEALQ